MVGQAESKPKGRKTRLRGWLFASGSGAFALLGVFTFNVLVQPVTTTAETVGKSLDKLVRKKLGADEVAVKPVGKPVVPVDSSVASTAPVAARASATIGVALQSAISSNLDQPASAGVRDAVAALGGSAVQRVDLSLGRPERRGTATVVGVAWRLSGAAGHIDCSDHFQFFTPQELGRNLGQRVRRSVISSSEGEFSCG